jgi:hypothetical protein
MLQVELDDSDGEAWDGYGGDRIQVRWITVGKVPAKHVSTPMLKSVCNRERVKWKVIEIVYFGVKAIAFI